MHATSEFLHRRTCWNERSRVAFRVYSWKLAYLNFSHPMLGSTSFAQINGWLAYALRMSESFVVRNEMQSFLCGWSVHSLSWANLFLLRHSLLNQRRTRFRLQCAGFELHRGPGFRLCVFCLFSILNVTLHALFMIAWPINVHCIRTHEVLTVNCLARSSMRRAAK